MEKIPKIFVINLPHRTDRLASITFELERMGFLDKMEIVEGVIIQTGEHGVAGIAEAHARCVELARDRGYEMIMVLQDDCKFLVDKDTFNKEIQEFITTAPSDWTGLWFGSFWTAYPNDRHVNWNLACTMVQDTGVLIHSRFYQSLIDGYRLCRDKYIESGDDKYNIDQWLTWSKLPFYILKKTLCGQADDYSDRTFEPMYGGHNIKSL